MAFTNNSDFYVAIHDAGINRIIKHVMRQRPSIFNYGTAMLLSRPELLCKEIDVAPDVISAGNPIITVLPPLPVIGTSLALNYCIQATIGEVDFHSGNVFSLPPELDPLASQRYAVHFQSCAGIGCPPKDISIPGTPTYRFSDARSYSAKDEETGMFTHIQKEITVLPTSRLNCFCIDLFATGCVKVAGSSGYQKMLLGVDGIEIVDLRPEGLENSIECYSLLALNQGILPVVGEAISNVAFDVINLPDSLGQLRVSASPTVPNNPAIEDDQLKAFINLDNIDLNITVAPTTCGGAGGGGGGSGTITRTTRSRTRSGIFDLTAAISEKTFKKIFEAVVQAFSFSCSDGASWGPFSANYAVAAHLEGGSVDLKNNGTITVSELDIKWDTLSLDLCIDIPEVCVGGFCIIPNPFDGCWVSAPSFCFFSASPDFCIPLNLSGLITSEITFSAGVQVFYGVGSGVPNRWQIVIVPTLPFDLDIIDIADTVGDLVENLIDAAIDMLLGGAPGWVKDLVKAILGPIDDIIRFILDIPDDIGEWLLDILTDLGVFDGLLNAFNGFLTNLVPPLEIEDPYPVLPAAGSLIPVKTPIDYIGVTINTDEMVIEGDIGN
jgi:hypothetical protein